MTLTNKTKHIIIHKSCKCVCRLDPIVCNSKQKWNKDKCRKNVINLGILTVVNVNIEQYS